MRPRCGCARLVCALLPACGPFDVVAMGQAAYRVFPVRQVTTQAIPLDNGRMGINNRGEIAFTDFDEARAYVWLPLDNNDYVSAISACEAFLLPLPPGGTESTAHDVSDFGLVTGSAMVSGEQHAVVWDLTGGGGGSVTVTDLADAGLFTWDTDFVIRPIVAWSVNDLDPAMEDPEVIGDVLGKFRCNCPDLEDFTPNVNPELGFHVAFSAAGGAIQHLLPVQDAPDNCDVSAKGLDVNDSVKMAGGSGCGGTCVCNLGDPEFDDCPGVADNAVEWEEPATVAGALDDLDSPPAMSGAEARGNNDPNNIVGWGDDPNSLPQECLVHALFWTGPGPSACNLGNNLPAHLQGGQSRAESINDPDPVTGTFRIVGWDDTAGTGLLWEGMATTDCETWTSKDLTELACCGWTILQARDINNSEEIVAYGTKNGIDRYVLFLRPKLTCCNDIDGSGDVGINDLLDLLALWGGCDPPNCPSNECSSADLDCDGSVGIGDLLQLLACWGPCGTCVPEGAPQSVDDCIERYGYEDPLVLYHCICAVDPCAEGCPPEGCQ